MPLPQAHGVRTKTMKYWEYVEELATDTCGDAVDLGHLVMQRLAEAAKPKGLIVQPTPQPDPDPDQPPPSSPDSLAGFAPLSGSPHHPQSLSVVPLPPGFPQHPHTVFTGPPCFPGSPTHPQTLLLVPPASRGPPTLSQTLLLVPLPPRVSHSSPDSLTGHPSLPELPSLH